MTTSHGENDWKVRINGGESHPVDHAHVLYRDGYRVSISLDTMEILNNLVYFHQLPLIIGYVRTNYH